MSIKHSRKTFSITPSPTPNPQETEETVKSTCPNGHLLTEFPATSFLQLHETPLFHNTLSGSFSESRQPWLIPSGETINSSEDLQEYIAIALRSSNFAHW